MSGASVYPRNSPTRSAQRAFLPSLPSSPRGCRLWVSPASLSSPRLPQDGSSSRWMASFKPLSQRRRFDQSNAPSTRSAAFAPRALPRFITTMPPSDSSTPIGLAFPQGLYRPYSGPTYHVGCRRGVEVSLGQARTPCSFIPSLSTPGRPFRFPLFAPSPGRPYGRTSSFPVFMPGRHDLKPPRLHLRFGLKDLLRPSGFGVAPDTLPVWAKF